MDEKRDEELSVSEELRAAWFGVRPPDADELRDPLTASVVQRLRSLYAGVQPSPESAHEILARLAGLRPARAGASGPRAASSLPDPWAAAIAAAVIAVCGAGLWRAGGTGELSVVEDDSQRITALTEEVLEMRSGPVRLVLLTNDGGSEADAVPKR